MAPVKLSGECANVGGKRERERVKLGSVRIVCALSSTTECKHGA